MIEANYDEMRRSMVASQLRTTGVNDPRVLAAMGVVARESFAPLERRAGAYADAMMPLAEGRGRLRALPGIGEWTVSEVSQTALGDGDAVSVGDYHLKNAASWALAGEPRGTDERMVELLEPFRPHRGRVLRLIAAAGISPPKYGPRLTIQPKW